MGTVKQTFTGDSKDLENAYQRIEKENVKLREANQQLSKESRQHHGEREREMGSIAEHLDKQIDALTEAAAEWLTVNKAMELVNESYERQIELQEKALDVQKEAGAARPQLYRNLAGLKPEEMREIREQLDDIQAAHAIPGEGTLNAAMVQATSAAGGDWRKGLTIVETAVQMVPDAAQNPQELAALAGGLGDISKVSGEQDPEKNLGFLLALMRTSRVASMADASKNLIPAAYSIVQHGATQAQAFALISALGQSIEDPTGEQTGTGLIKFAESVHKFFQPKEIEGRARHQLTTALSPEFGEETDHDTLGRVRGFLSEKGVGNLPRDERQFAGVAKDLLQKDHPEWAVELLKRETSRVKVSPDNLAEQIAFLQSHAGEAKELDEKFVSEGAFEEGRGAFGRARTIAALRGLVSKPDSLMSQQYEQFSGQLPSGEAASDLARQQVAQLHGDKAVQQLQKAQASEVMEEQGNTALLARGDVQALRELAEKAGDVAGAGFMTHWGMKVRFDWATFFGNPEEEARRQVQLAIMALRYSAEQYDSAAGKGTGRSNLGNDELDMSQPFHLQADGRVMPGPGPGVPLYRRKNAEKEEAARAIERGLETFDRAHARRAAEPGEQAEPLSPAAPEEAAEAAVEAAESGAAVQREPPASQEASPVPAKGVRTSPPEPRRLTGGPAAPATSAPAEEWRPEIPAGQERDNERDNVLWSLPEGGTQEVKPRFSKPDWQALWNAQQSESSHGAIDERLLDLVDHRPKLDVDEGHRLLKQLRHSQRDLAERGHYEGDRWVDDKQEPTGDDRRQAAELGPAIAVLEKLLEATQETNRKLDQQREQERQQHRESQTGNRSRNARADGAGFKGRE